MDPQSFAGILTRPVQGGALLACLLLGGCGSETESAAPHPLPALAGPSTLLRLPRAGGQAVAYVPEDLREAGWTTTGRLGALQRPLGVDLDERMVLAVDTDGNLVAIDLDTRAVRGSVVSGVAAATLAGDGSVYLIDTAGAVTHLLRRMPTRFRASLPGPPSQLFGALNDRLVAVTTGEVPAVVVVEHDVEGEPYPVPAGEAAATLWGDLLAIAADTAVVFYDAQRQTPRPSLRINGGVRSVAFSPSGDRLYVARARPDLLVFDRFSHDRLATVVLPSPAAAIRPDASGRWVMLRVEGADSIDVIDATVNRVVARIAGGWQEDLPLVAGSATLVLRHGDAVEAWDLAQASPQRTGMIEDGARDFWSLVAWVPPARAVELAEAAETTGVVQDSAIVFGVIPAPVLTPPSRVFLQVSSSQNEAWARELARQLSSTGFPALVRDPQAADDGYRVLLGPYPTREVAEEAGRRLGRPYFVLTDPGTANQ